MAARRSPRESVDATTRSEIWLDYQIRINQFDPDLLLFRWLETKIWIGQENEKVSIHADWPYIWFPSHVFPYYSWCSSWVIIDSISFYCKDLEKNEKVSNVGHFKGLAIPSKSAILCIPVDRISIRQKKSRCQIPRDITISSMHMIV
jgi:hypothetical protein